MSNKTPVGVMATSRPLSIAFLVDFEKTTAQEIDQIVAYCSKSWGGAYFPIIPFDGHDIQGDWWDLLRTVDPDIIHSSVNLDETLVKKINRYIMPIEIVEVLPAQRGKDARDYLAGHNLEAVTCQSAPNMIWATKGPIQKPLFIYLHGNNYNSKPGDKRFFTRNFGEFDSTIWWKHAFEGVPTLEININDEDLESIFNNIKKAKGELVFPRGLTRYGTSLPLSFDYSRFHSGRHIVVGDDLESVAYAWNRTYLHDVGLNLPTMWLPESLSDSSLDQVIHFIKQRGWGPHNTEHKVVSFKTPKDQLEKICEKFKKGTGQTYTAIVLEPNIFHLPKLRTYINNNGSHSRTYHLQDPELPTLIETPTPEYSQGPNSRESWAVDFEIGPWRLPKFMGLAGTFFQPSIRARSCRSGRISTIVRNEESKIFVRVPTMWTLTHTLFHGLRFKNFTRRQQGPDVRLFKDARSSDKGSYLSSIIDLFGNLYSAGDTLENPFWREIFLSLAAKPTENLDDVKTDINKLVASTKLTDGSKVLFSTTDFDKIITDISTLVFKRRNEQAIRPVSRKSLISKFDQTKRQLGEETRRQHFAENEKFDEFKQSDLENFLSNRVLFQGAEVRCPSCGTKDWRLVDDLRTQMTCRHCFMQFPLLPDPEWTFKLNGLIENGLNRHGILAVIQALFLLQQSANGHFEYLSGVAISKTNGEKFDACTDVDIVAFAKNRLILAEVKSTPKMFKEDEFDKMAEVIREILPQHAFFFASVNNSTDVWPSWMDGRIVTLNKELEWANVSVRKHLMKRDWLPDIWS